MAAEGQSVRDAAGRWEESCPSPCTVPRKEERGDSQVTTCCPGHPLSFLAGQGRTGPQKCWMPAGHRHFPRRAPWFMLGPRLAGQSDLLGAWGLHLSVGLLTRCLPPSSLWGGLPPSSGHPHQLPAAWHLHGALARPRTAHGHVLVFQLTSEQEAGPT